MFESKLFTSNFNFRFICYSSKQNNEFFKHYLSTINSLVA